ncbi:MAG TPA: glycosyltransferase family 39 protein [bacterium]|nr:glycosyltransferase family 39 protein [bacterium]
MRLFSGLKRGQRVWLISIVAVGLIARVVWMFATPYFVPVTQQADPQEYNQLAKNLVAGEGYCLKGLSGRFRFLMRERLNEPSARRPPLYPLFLALVYRIFGERYRAVFLLQCFFDVVTMFAVFALSRRLFGSVSVGLLATGLTAAYLPFFQQNIVLMAENLSMMLTTLSLWAMAEAIATPKIRLFVLSGLLLGAAALTRPESFALALPLSIVLFFILRAEKIGMRRAALMPVLMLLAVCTLLSPWVIRNALVFHRFLPGTTLVGTNMMEGLYIPSQRNVAGLGTSIPPDIDSKVDGLPEVQANDILLREAFKFLWRNPWSWLSNAPQKIVNLWLNAANWEERYFLYYPTTNRNHYIQYSFLIPNVVLLIFSAIAVFCYRGRWLLLASPILLTLAFFTFTETFTVSVGRHSMKMMPSLIVLASFGLHRTFIKSFRLLSS